MKDEKKLMSIRIEKKLAHKFKLVCAYENVAMGEKISKLISNYLKTLE